MHSPTDDPDGQQDFDVAASMNYWQDRVPDADLNMGIPFYGRSFTGVPDSHHRPFESFDSGSARTHDDVKANVEALSAFREEVATCQPSQPAAPLDRNDHGTLVSGHQTKTPHARIRAAYRDTVMRVADYGDVYGSSLPEDIAAEFGTDLAAGLCHEAPFTEIFKTRLLGVVEEAASSSANVAATVQERARVGVAVVGIEVDPHIEDVQCNTVLVDDPFDGRREVSHRPLET